MYVYVRIESRSVDNMKDFKGISHKQCNWCYSCDDIQLEAPSKSPSERIIMHFE